MKSFSNLGERIFQELEEGNNSQADALNSHPKSHSSAEKIPSQEEEKSEKQVRDDRQRHIKRKNSSYSKWTETDKKNFWIKNLEEMSRYPEKIHSWNHWKPDRYFHEMAKFLATKTASQCKSFDQRMKNHFYLCGKHPIDLPQATVLSLEPCAAEDQLLYTKLQKFKMRRAGHSQKAQIQIEVGSDSLDKKGQQIQQTQEFRELKKDYMIAIEKYIEFFKGEGKQKFEKIKSAITKYQLS